jgi:serine/threonine-protein kinase
VSADTPKTPSPDRLPKAIGPYAIRERIGKGAMGVVYRAIHEAARSEVALKVMASDLDGDPETRERFFREAHVAGRLRHRNIVAVRDSGEDGGRLYIAMELLRGATLNEYLKQPEAFDLEDRIDLMIQVCQGLAVAHAAGVFHRDLKPANLFVCQDRRVKILDFGVARLVGSNMTITGNIIGTPDFMSPEQVRGEEIDGRSDIFSAGSVFYLLLTGRKPFAANDLPAVLNKVVRSQPLPIRDTEAPEPVAMVIRKAMSKDPAARHQDVGELAAELMAAACAVEAGTRQTALALRTTASEVMRLAARATALAAALELTGVSVDPWPAIHERFPILRRGVDVLGSRPFRSRVMQELHDILHGELDSLTGEVTRIEDGQAKFAAGKILLERGAFEHALKEFDAARRVLPSSPLIERTIQAAADALAQQREREARLQARLALATEAADRSDWEGVLSITQDLEATDASQAAIARLREMATRNLDAERARPARSGVRLTPASAAPAPSGAHRVAQSAPPLDDTTQPIVPLDRKGSLPGERAVRAAQLREQAARHMAGGDLAGAERVATEAMTLDSADQESQHLLERVRAAVTLRSRQEANGRRIVELLKRADDFAESQRFDRALALCDEALQIEPTHEGAVAARQRLAEEYAAHEEARDREAARQQRLRAAAPALEAAKRAFESGDLERARWSAENALALAPDSPVAQALLGEITAAMPAPSPDDTVKLGDSTSEETAELAPLQPSVQERVRSQASNWMRVFRSSDAKTKG